MRSNQNPMQPGSAPSAVPYFNPMAEIRQPTAEEMIKKVILDVKAEKEREKESKIDISAYNLPKCDLHPKKLSNTCRKCKKIKEQMEEIEKKKQQEKEKLNPENRLREILNEGAASGQPEDLRHKKNPNAPMAIWGDPSTFNMNELLRNNIKSSPYFNELFAMRTIPEVIDEIIKKATHAEPWVSGHQGIPSTFFCCLLRLMMMRLSENQVRELTDYKGSSLVRCAGFLYLRYCCNPESLWDWFGKYMLDEEEVHPAANADVVMSIGEYAEALLTDMNYYNTIFPRIPLVIDREIKKNILIMRDRRFRKRKNMDQFDEFVKGARVMAISSEDNDWHEATLVRVEGWHMRVRFTHVKEQNDDADFTLELLEKKFQGEEVFMGGDEVLVDLGEIMTPSDTIEYLKSYGDEAEGKGDEQKAEKMEEEPKKVERKSEEREKPRESRKKKGRSASSSSSSSSSSSDSDRDKRKRKHGKRRDDKRKSRRGRSSSSESSSSSSSRSRSRDRKKNDRRRREKSRDRSKERRREKDRRKEKPRKEESPERSPSRSKSKGRDDSPKRRRAEVKPKEKTDKYMERVLQMQAEGASARSKAEYAARPVSYKSSLSANAPGGGRKKQSRSRSPNKKVVVVKQEGRRRNEEEEVEAPKQKQLPSAEALERMRKLKEQYGESSNRTNTGSQKNRDLGEGPDVLKLGN